MKNITSDICHFLRDATAFLLLLVVTFLAASLLQGCKNDSLATNVAATVNGEPITLNALQTLMDSRLGAMGVSPQPSLAEMKKDYGQALAILVAQTLVRQELNKRGMSVSENELDSFIQELNQDSDRENIDSLMKDASLRQEDWRELMRDHLALEKFRRLVLLPGIRASREEIKDFYKEHKKEFSLPDYMHICYLTAQDKQSLEQWCARFPNADIAEDNITGQCLYGIMADVPNDWSKEVKDLKPGTCAKIRQVENEWQTVAIIAREKGRQPGLAEIYAMIENEILANKQNEEFERWLEQKLATSDIKVVPELNDCLASMDFSDLTSTAAAPEQTEE